MSTTKPVKVPVRTPTDADRYPVAFVRCTRGSSPATKGSSCDSRRAYKMSRDGSPNPMYKCVKCKHTFTVNVGGSFSL